MASLLVGAAATTLGTATGGAALGMAGAGAGTMAGVAGAVAGTGAVAGGMSLGTIAALGGLGLATAGIVGQGLAAAQQAKGQQAIAQYNARVQEVEARAIEAEAGLRQRRQVGEAARLQGSLVASLAASGVVPGEGTPLLIEARQAAESELETLLIGYQGQVGASRARSQARIDRMQAGTYGSAAGSARTAGFIGAGTTLLQGYSKYKWGLA